MADSGASRAWLGLALVVLVTTPAAADTGKGTPDLARGARLYSDNCARCHNGRGPSEFSDAEWPLIITHMRVTAGLPGEQARAIDAFLRASNNPPPLKLAASRPVGQSGMDLINHYGCRGCHQIGGSGGTIGPNLSGVFERRSIDWIRTQIQDPTQHNEKTRMPLFGLSDQATEAIIQALRSAH